MTYIRQWVEVGGISYPEYGCDHEECDEMPTMTAEQAQYFSGRFHAVFFDSLEPESDDFDFVCGWKSMRAEMAERDEDFSIYDEF